MNNDIEKWNITDDWDWTDVLEIGAGVFLGLTGFSIIKKIFS